MEHKVQQVSKNMRLSRFYNERKNLRVGSSVKLGDSDINHIRKVLRLKKHDKIILFNGEKEYLADLYLITNSVVMVRLEEELVEKKEQNTNKVSITLFQCLLRAGKFDFIIEKATELGVDNIIPVEAEFSQSKIDAAASKIDRWNKVSIAAAKQSERITIPQILNPINFKDIENVLDEFDAIYFFTIPRKNIKESLEAINLKDIESGLKESDMHSLKRIAFVIGPEGGFSPTEHSLANQWKLKFVKFGNTVLRSETAALAILSVLQYIFNS